MAYAKSSVISAADIKGFQDRVMKLWGQGTGDYGYGQTGYESSPVPVSGGVIDAQTFRDMRDALNVMIQHQNNTVPTALPPLSVLEVGDVVTAHESDAPSNNAYDLNSVISQAETNRFVGDSSSMVLESSVETVVHTGNWSDTITTVIDCEFASEDAARYFFNTGGQIRMRFLHPNGTSTQDDDWRDIFTNKVGTLTFGTHFTSNTGTTNASLASVGYYEMTSADKVIYNGANIGSGAYTVNDLMVYASYQNYTGVRGAKGTTVRFTISMFDQHTNVYSDVVASGTSVKFDVYRSSTYFPVASPVFSIVDPL